MSAAIVVRDALEAVREARQRTAEAAELLRRTAPSQWPRAAVGVADLRGLEAHLERVAALLEVGTGAVA